MRKVLQTAAAVDYVVVSMLQFNLNNILLDWCVEGGLWGAAMCCCTRDLKSFPLRGALSDEFTVGS